MSEADRVFQDMGFDPEKAQVSEAVIYSLARTFSLVSRRLVGVYKPYSLSPASVNLLMLLKHGTNPECFTQQEIGRRLVVSASDMTGLIDRLERKGLAKRFPGKDRRSKLIRITEKGAALLEELWPRHLAAMEQLTGVMSKQDASGLLRGLERLREAAV